MNSSMRAADRIEAIGFAIEGTRSAISGAEPWTGSPTRETECQIMMKTAERERERTHNETITNVDRGNETERTDESGGTITEIRKIEIVSFRPRLLER